MNGFARGFGTVVLSLTGLLVVLAGIGYGVTIYLDDIFGRGATALVFAILIGISMTVLIYTLSNFQNNQTHRAAGEDITEFHASSAKTQQGWYRVQQEYARADREYAAGMVKGRLMEKKADIGREEWLWRQEQRRRAEEAKRKADEEAEAAEWSWVDGSVDADAPVYYQ